MNISIGWKDIIRSFDIIGSCLSWKVGDGLSVCLDEDPWVGCNPWYKLHDNMTEFLHDRGYNNLNSIFDVGASSFRSQGWLTT